MRTIVLDMDYQPIVGETLTKEITGRVVAVRFNPFEASTIEVELEIAAPGGDGPRRGWTPPVPVGIGGGDT